jgi:hypothetical protein
MRAGGPALILSGLLALAGCAMDGPRTCSALGTKPMLVAELFFGRDIAGAAGVTDAEWDSFVADTLGRRFPDGFTVLDAQGQWFDPERRTVSREATKYVVIAAADSSRSLDDLDFVMKDYERRFHQQSVGLLLDHRCGAF